MMATKTVMHPTHCISFSPLSARRCHQGSGFTVTVLHVRGCGLVVVDWGGFWEFGSLAAGIREQGLELGDCDAPRQVCVCVIEKDRERQRERRTVLRLSDDVAAHHVPRLGAEHVHSTLPHPRTPVN